MLLTCYTEHARKFGKLSKTTGLENISFHCNPKERQCQRMFKLPYNCTHLQFSRSVVSDSVRPLRQQPTRLRRPWDFPGKNTGVGCHFLFQCMKVKSESEVAQLCLTLRDPIDYSLPGSSVHGSFQARVLEWGAIALSAIVW